MTVIVRPLPMWVRFLDLVMVPIMYLVSGTLSEAPQQTHRWNNQKLRGTELEKFDKASMVFDEGLKGEADRWWGKLPIFHLPILGGWKKYVVLSPQMNGIWHVGWWSDDVGGVSRLPLNGPVRMLIGPRSTKFFGIDMEGKQVPLTRVGEGRVGMGGPYVRIPLL